MQKKRGDAKVTNKKRVGLNVPKGLYEVLKEEAAITGQTMNGLLVQILWEWVKREENQHDH